MIVSGSLKAILSKKQHAVGWVFNPPTTPIGVAVKQFQTALVVIASLTKVRRGNLLKQFLNER